MSSPGAEAQHRPQADFVAQLSSRVGFGCAGLMQSTSRAHRQRLLAEAFEHGIRHFDVARMYGLGAAEHELGRFARGRRDEIVIATKFGIEPAKAAGRLAQLQAPARAALARLPALRAAVKRRAAAFHQPHCYDVTTMTRSLERSLIELGTEYVDVLFVHGPGPEDELDIDELTDELEELRREGRVRAWGFAGDPDPCIRLMQESRTPGVLQLRDDILAGGSARLSSRQRLITFGILSGALSRVVTHITSSGERAGSWTRMIGEDCARPEVIASLLLQDALERNPGGMVLFSTSRPERLETVTRAVEAQLSDSERAPLQAFRSLVAAELLRCSVSI